MSGPIQQQYAAGIKQKLLAGKAQGKPPKAKPPKPTQDADYNVIVAGQFVMVNGCRVYEGSAGFLRASDGDEDYQVRCLKAQVYDWSGLTFDGGIAKIGDNPLSLEARWEFRWGVVIADTDKYMRAALDKLNLNVTKKSQIHKSIDSIDGYSAHISIDALGVRREIRKFMAKGSEPPTGFLSGCDFHVTVEAWGEDHGDNPRAFDYASWKGKVPSKLKTSAKSAKGMGQKYLNEY